LHIYDYLEHLTLQRDLEDCAKLAWNARDLAMEATVCVNDLKEPTLEERVDPF